MLGEWESERGEAPASLIVEEGTWTFRYNLDGPREPGPWRRCRMTTDPTMTPAPLDIELLARPGEEPLVCRGIVKVDGDVMTYFYTVDGENRPRPRTFYPVRMADTSYPHVWRFERVR